MAPRKMTLTSWKYTWLPCGRPSVRCAGALWNWYLQYTGLQSRCGRRGRGHPLSPSPSPPGGPHPAAQIPAPAHRPPPPTTEAPVDFGSSSASPKDRAHSSGHCEDPGPPAGPQPGGWEGSAGRKVPPAPPGMSSATQTGPMPPLVPGPGTEKAERRGLQDRESVCPRQTHRGAGKGHPEHIEHPRRTGVWCKRPGRGRPVSTRRQGSSQAPSLLHQKLPVATVCGQNTHCRCHGTVYFSEIKADTENYLEIILGGLVWLPWYPEEIMKKTFWRSPLPSLASENRTETPQAGGLLAPGTDTFWVWLSGPKW